jgi:hypothetical protein
MTVYGCNAVPYSAYRIEAYIILVNVCKVLCYHNHKERYIMGNNSTSHKMWVKTVGINSNIV